MSFPPKDLTGQRFGRLVARVRIGTRTSGKSSRSVWLCDCDCGQEIEADTQSLLRGRRKSCDCLKHGFSRTKVYQAWSDMKQRCLNDTNDRFGDYGGRGLELDPDWVEAPEGFTLFHSEVGDPPTKEHSLERIDNDLGYVSGNVRWALPTEQARNRRTNHLITYDGRSQCLTDWARELGIPEMTLFARIDTYGWSVKRSFTQPVQARYRTGAQCPDDISDLLDDL